MWLAHVTSEMAGFDWLLGWDGWLFQGLGVAGAVMSLCGRGRSREGDDEVVQRCDGGWRSRWG